MAKTKVLVLYGGKSTEHEVSCRSAAYVLKNLDRKKYEVEAVGINKDGKWLKQDVPKLLEGDPSVIAIEPTPALAPLGEGALLGSTSDQPVVVFPVLHGTNGEDGRAQGLLDLAEVAYVGADTTGSSVGMDKVLSKRLVEAAGVPIVPYVSMRQEAWQANKNTFIEKIDKSLTYPVFVKPARLGSSVGISKVLKSGSELIMAIDEAFEFDEKVLVETGITGREIECAALGGYDPKISEIGEIRMASAEFYDYEAKYLSEDGAEIIIPADLSAEQRQQVHAYAKLAFGALDLYGMARIDFFLDDATGTFYFNEVNTLPGFTSISQYPLLWKASGLEAADLLDRLVELALERWQSRQDLVAVKN